MEAEGRRRRKCGYNGPYHPQAPSPAGSDPAKILIGMINVYLDLLAVDLIITRLETAMFEI